MLRKQSAQVYQQASSSAVNLEQLQQAFTNIYTAMDQISDYKVQALGTMQQTVNALTSEVKKAQSYLDRVRSEEANDAVENVTLTAENEIRI
jgi:uncharacterized protein YaaN involved in tellurite resistance